LVDLIASVVAYISAKALKRRLVKKGASNNNFDLEVVDVEVKSERPKQPEEDINFQLTGTGWKVELEENYLDCEIKAETLLADRRGEVKRNSMPTLVVPQPESSMSAKHSKAAGKARASRLIKSSFDRKDSRLVSSLV